MHEGLKPFKCTVCDKAFAYPFHVKKHIEAVHDGKKPYLCTLCGISFADNGNLSQHIKAVHHGIKRRQIKRKKNMES